MSRPSVASPSQDRSWSKFRRELDGLAQKVRMETLADRLVDVGALAVRHDDHGVFGDRATFWLDDGTVMKLRLFWPRRKPLAAITFVRFERRIGWVVGARTTSGEAVTYFAWSARIRPAPATAPLGVA